MLLFIALANVAWYLYDRPGGIIGAHPEPGSIPDKVAQALMITFVDGRIFPLFAFLFGYGMVQFYTSRRRQGLSDKDVRTMVARRHWAMFGLGAAHAILLFVGDVLTSYAIAGLVVGAIFFRHRTGVLKWWLIIPGSLGALVAGLMVVIGILAGPGTMEPLDIAQSTAGEPNYVASMRARTVIWAETAAVAGLFFTIPMLLLASWVAARVRLLEDAAQHRRRLVTIAALTLPISWAAGAAQALQQIGVLTSIAPWTFTAWEMFVGPIAGPGYAALFALLAIRYTDRRPAWVLAVSAVGQRSLSCYLWQSIIMAPVLSAWGLGLGGRLSTWSSLLFAAGVWLVSVVIADQLRRHGNRRGPFELLLRRLTYGGIPARAQPVTGPVLMPWEMPAGWMLPPAHAPGAPPPPSWTPPQGWAPPPPGWAPAHEAMSVSAPPAAPATPVRPRDPAR